VIYPGQTALGMAARTAHTATAAASSSSSPPALHVVPAPSPFGDERAPSSTGSSFLYRKQSSTTHGQHQLVNNNNSNFACFWLLLSTKGQYFLAFREYSGVDRRLGNNALQHATPRRGPAGMPSNRSGYFPLMRSCALSICHSSKGVWRALRLKAYPLKSKRKTQLLLF
jgi:hypothetical protein